MIYQRIRLKKNKLGLIVTLFFYIMSGSISHGMEPDSSESGEYAVGCGRPKSIISRQQDESVEFQNPEELHNQFNEKTNLIPLDVREGKKSPVSSISFSQPTLPDDGSIELENQSSEETILTNRLSGLSNFYVLAFKEDDEEVNSKFLAFKYITSLVAGIGPIIPQIAIALKVGEYYDSPVLGYCLIGATILSIEGITAWLVCELIDEAHKLVKTTKQYQINSNPCNLQSIKEAGIGVLSLVLGALSSAPDVYKTYKYNDIKEFAIISFIYDTIPRTIGFYKFFSSLKSLKLKLSKTCSEENIAEKQATAFIDLSKAYFLNECRKNGAIDVRNTLKDYETPNEIYTYLSSNFSPGIMEETSYSYGKGIPRAAAEYLSLIFPLASATFNMVLAYRGYELLIDNPVAISLLSGFSVLPTFVLSSYVIKQAAGSLFDKFYLCKSSVPLSDYFSVFHPKTNATFISISFLLGVATSVGGFYLIADNMEGTFLQPVKYVFAALAVGTDLTFGSYTVYSTFTNFGEVIKGQCNKGASYTLNCLKKLGEVRDSILNSSSDLITSFINEINPFSATSDSGDELLLKKDL